MKNAYLSIPLCITMTGAISPETAATSLDYSVGLIPFNHNIIHNMSVSVNGNLVKQQTNILTHKDKIEIGDYVRISMKAYSNTVRDLYKQKNYKDLSIFYTPLIYIVEFCFCGLIFFGLFFLILFEGMAFWVDLFISFM